ncbi:MAG: hypothetical protein HY758_00355 [Nitrospirae bacterium]|nr:hypothetical protein [Nitrospirota bacterium]
MQDKFAMNRLFKETGHDNTLYVIPAKAGIHANKGNPGFPLKTCGNDREEEFSPVYDRPSGTRDNK